MSSTILIVIGLAIYAILYFTYGKSLERKVVVADSSRRTPAHKLSDGVDYVPSNKWVLFGHHFASIAGAAPIVGPAIAMAWGWLPAILWVWLGNIFIGAVHDYLALMSSVRHDGKSVQWIAGRLMTRRTGYAFSWYVECVLILVIAAFAAIIAGIFAKNPAVPSASFFFLVSAVIFGYILYKAKMNFYLATAIGIVMMVAAIWLGFMFPMTLSYKGWLAILFIYIIVASALPVWVLLQPRDYLNAWLLWAGLAIGGVALLIAAKALATPGYTMWSAPVIAGRPSPFWPLIPLIIACGSLSGFHSLVSSGTSSKQLDNERSGLFVAYGGMLTEGFLSTIVVASIASFGLVALGEKAAALATPTDFGLGYGKAIGPIGGPVGIFSKSYALGVNAGLGLSVQVMTVFAGLWVSAFALTTLDTANRLARFAIEEIVDPLRDKAPGFHGVFANRWIASLIPAFVGIYLAWGGGWTIIWPAFGGANQLLASIALLTGAVWVSKVLKASSGYRLSVLIPALFLWVTVTLALAWYLVVAVPTFIAKAPAQAWILGIITVIMLGLNLLLFYDFIQAMRREEIVAYEAA